MKKYVYLTLALVLTASVLVGCGCTNQNMQDTSAPTVLPTNEEIWNQMTTQPAQQSSMPTTMATQPSETHDRGNGPLEDETTGATGNTDTTTETGGDQSRSRGAMPSMR